jgi:sulfite exporter TauE/SafE
MAQETRFRSPAAEREARRHGRPVPDEVELEAYGRDRTYVTLAAVVNALAGVLAVAAPWLTDYTSGDRRWAPIAAGAVMIAAAVGRLVAPAATRTLWTALPILAGIFLLGAAIWLTSSSAAALADTVCGIGAMVIALLTMDSGDPVTDRP